MCTSPDGAHAGRPAGRVTHGVRGARPVPCGGLPTPELQYIVRDAAGVFLARADFAWPEQRVLVEFDGDLHRERDVFVKDTRRQNGVVLVGWTMLRYTSADALGRGDGMVAEVRRAIRA